jgi:hypothetical protein
MNCTADDKLVPIADELRRMLLDRLLYHHPTPKRISRSSVRCKLQTPRLVLSSTLSAMPWLKEHVNHAVRIDI